MSCLINRFVDDFILEKVIYECLFQIIDFELPITVQLTVVDVDPGARGSTIQGNDSFTFLDSIGRIC